MVKYLVNKILMYQTIIIYKQSY